MNDGSWRMGEGLVVPHGGWQGWGKRSMGRRLSLHQSEYCVVLRPTYCPTCQPQNNSSLATPSLSFCFNNNIMVVMTYQSS